MSVRSIHFLPAVVLMIAGTASLAAPVAAQEMPAEAKPGSVAGSTVGQAGRRQTRDQEVGGIKPMIRIDGRVANRVQSRLRTRIDRDYDPQANATSPFTAAEAEVRTTGRPRKR